MNMQESFAGRVGQPLCEIGLVGGGTRTVYLDRAVTLYKGGNYLIRDCMYRVSHILNGKVYIHSI